MFAYQFIAGMAILLGCFGISEVQLSRMPSRKDD